MLELAIAHELYERYPDCVRGATGEAPLARRLAPELRGRRARARARRAARRGAGKELAGRRARPLVKNRNVSAALLEAALAALFLEHGFEAIEPAIVAAFSDRIEYARTSHVDHKTELQEALAKRAAASRTRCSRSRGRRTSGTSPARR